MCDHGLRRTVFEQLNLMLMICRTDESTFGLKKVCSVVNPSSKRNVDLVVFGPVVHRFTQRAGWVQYEVITVNSGNVDLSITLLVNFPLGEAECIRFRSSELDLSSVLDDGSLVCEVLNELTLYLDQLLHNLAGQGYGREWFIVDV
jgi:hypothetical protein